MIINTTVNGGLPVAAEANVIVEAQTWYEPGVDSVEDVEIRFRDGYPYRHEISAEDLERIENEFVRAYYELRRYKWSEDV